MKKSLFFALAVAGGLLSSCSSEDAISTSVDNNHEDLVPIQLGVSNQTVTGVRGTGTVGGVYDETNEVMVEEGTWQGQLVNVYMLNAGTLDPAEFSSELGDLSNLNGPIFENAIFKTPSTGTAGEATRYETDPTRVDKIGEVKYYPSVGVFDFYGYRLDDAAIAEPVTSETTISVPFTLDGSQDVMVAKAVPAAEDLAQVGAERIYSAYAARRDVQPNLSFKHLLTRLRFNVAAGNKTSSENIKVVGISVMSKANGNLIVASLDEEGQRIEFTDETANTEFKIKKRADDTNAGENLVPLLPDGTDLETAEGIAAAEPYFVGLGWDEATDTGIKTRVGEALLVSPETEYQIIIKLSQRVVINKQEDGTETFNTEIFQTKFPLSLNEAGDPFLASHSYTVNATVFGLQDIKLTTTLEPWIDGGSVDITPEDIY